jgi:hypothetical protein
MSLVPLATFKQHIKVEDDETDEGAVAAHLCRPLIAADATPAADTYELPLLPAVTAAILIMAGHLYANRETVVTGTISTELPMSVQFLLAPHRVWAPDPVEV